jgi:hypothetical protein
MAFRNSRRTRIGNNPHVYQPQSLIDKFKQKVTNLGRDIENVVRPKPKPEVSVAEQRATVEKQQETTRQTQSHSPKPIRAPVEPQEPPVLTDEEKADERKWRNRPGGRSNKIPPKSAKPGVDEDANRKFQEERAKQEAAQNASNNAAKPQYDPSNLSEAQLKQLSAEQKKEYFEARRATRNLTRAQRKDFWENWQYKQQQKKAEAAEPKPEEPTLKDKVKEKVKEAGKEAYKAVKDNLKDRKEKATATTAEQAEAIRTATMKTGLNGNVLYRKTDGSWFNSGRKARVAVGVDPDYIDPVTGLPMEIEPEKDEDDDDIEDLLKKMGSGSRSRSAWSPKSTRSSKYDDDETASPSVRGRTKQWDDDEEKLRLSKIEGASSPFAGSSYLSVGKARSQPETEEEEQARLASFSKNPLGIKKSQYSANTYRGWNQADEDRVRQSDTGAGSGMSALSSGLYKFGYGNKKPQSAPQPVPMQQQVQMPAEPRVRLNKADYAAYLQQKRMAEQEMPQSVPQQVAPEVQQPPQKRLTAVEEMFGLKMGMGVTHPSAPQQQARAPPQRASSAMQELFGVSFGNSPKPQSQKKPAKSKPVTQSKYFALGGEYKHTDHTNLQKLERTMGASLYSPKKLISGKKQKNLLMSTLGYSYGEEKPKKPTINKAIVKKCGSTGSRGLKKEVLGSGIVNHHMLEDLLGYSYGSKQKPKKQPVKVATKISVPKKFLKPETSISVTQELFGKRTRL